MKFKVLYVREKTGFVSVAYHSEAIAGWVAETVRPHFERVVMLRETDGGKFLLHRIVK